MITDPGVQQNNLSKHTQMFISHVYVLQLYHSVLVKHLSSFFIFRKYEHLFMSYVLFNVRIEYLLPILTYVSFDVLLPKLKRAGDTYLLVKTQY